MYYFGDGVSAQSDRALRFRELVYDSPNVLLENCGSGCLLKDFGNPFAFFRRYNEIARHSNGKYPAFSEESMALFEELEKRYVNDNLHRLL